MRVDRILVLSILTVGFHLFGAPSAFASGPAYITAADLISSLPCSDEDKSNACMVLCYKADTSFGEGGGCSTPALMTPKIEQKLSVVTTIFKDAKAKTKGHLSFGLEKTYFRGEGLLRRFTVEEFLDLVIEEQQLSSQNGEKPVAPSN